MKTKIKALITDVKRLVPKLRRNRWFYAGMFGFGVVVFSLFRILLAAHGAAPFGAMQYGNDHTTAIATGAYTTDGISNNLYLDSNVGSSNTTETFTPKVELRDVNTAFTNAVTNTGASVQYDANIPDKRRSTDMVYDSVNKQLVVFGGLGGDTGTMVNKNDVWVLSLTKGQRSQWKQLSPSGTAPSIRRTQQLIYDTANARVIVYGGWNGTTSDGNVYALSMTPGSEAWSTLTTAGTGPAIRVQHSAIYDSSNRRMIVYGGRNDGGTALSATVFQLTLPTSGTPTWSQPTVSGAPANGRELTTMLYDPVNQVAWMHGGCMGVNTTCTRQSDIYKLSLPSTGTMVWTQTNASCGPFSAGTEGVLAQSMGYDPVNQQAVIWAGKAVSYQSTFYTFNLPATGSPTCVDHSTEPIVSGSNFGGSRAATSAYGSTKGVYDVENKRMLFMFGYDGTTFQNETWVFDDLANAGTWENKVLAPIVYKRARDGNNMIYDSANNMVYEFGGAGRYAAPGDALHLPETWRLNTSGSLYWADPGADTAPFNREFGNFIYDEANQRGVYCFGLNHDWVQGDCWKMSINGANGRVSWSFLINSNALGTASSNRWGAASVYDSANDRMIVFGGENNTPTKLNDVQVLNLPAGGSPSWTTPTVTGTAPTVRQFAATVYDPVGQRMILFGGENGAADNNEVWELTLPASGSFAWRQMTPTGTAPIARSRTSVVYDANSGSPRLILFGGYDGANSLNDVWQLTIPGAGDGVWSQPAVTGTAPTARRSMGYVLDTANNRMIISSGRDATSFFGDTYAINLGASLSWSNLNPELTVPVSVPVSGLPLNKFHWQTWATGSVTGDMPKASYGGNSDTLPAATDFRTAPIPVAVSIAPSAGPAGGGTPFTLTGTGFVNESTVTIGGVAAPNIFVVSSTAISGLSPPGTAGARDVVVTNPLGDASTLTAAFTYGGIFYSQNTKTLSGDFTAAGSSLTNISASGIKIDEGVFQWLDSTPSTAGGSIAAGTYYYSVTATDFGGGETTRGVESRGVVTTGSTSSVSLKWRPVPGATGYKLYRTSTSGTYATPALITTISSVNSSTKLTAISYTDTTAATSAGAPPGSNTTNGELQLNRGTVPASGQGTFTAGPAVIGTAGSTVFWSSHSIQRPDGKFLVILGDNTSNTSIYDPVSNVFSAGPAILGTAANLADTGTRSLQRPDGKFLILLAGNTSNTSIYDPFTNSFAPGPAVVGTVSNGVGAGAHTIKRPDGKYLVVQGGTSSNTSIYDPILNTFNVGPAIIGTASNNAGGHAFSIERGDGKFLVILSTGTTNTSIYDPIANTFSAGTALNSNAGAGGHAILRPDGKWFIVLGSGTTASSIYDPIANTFSTGPTLANSIGNGGHAVQRPDGKYLIFIGSQSSLTYIYDPVANSVIDGPSVVATASGCGASPSSIYFGASSLQRPDGKFLIFMGGSNCATSIYDAGWRAGTESQNGSVGTYTSEDIELNGAVDKLGWVKTIDSFIQASDDTIDQIEVKTGSTANDLANASYVKYTNGSTLPSGKRWLKYKVTFRRAIPVWSRNDRPGAGVWVGEGSTFENRSFAMPDIQSVTVTYSNTVPNAPILILPGNSAVNVSINPQLRLASTDAESDVLRYRIELCSNNICSAILRTIDQTTSQTGWISQSALNATAYSSSQEAVHNYQDPALSATTQYWWRVYAIDPNGTNTWSTASAINTFTTGNANSTNLKIQGGTNIRGGTRLGN